jgi:hypothetical protein
METTLKDFVINEKVIQHMQDHLNKMITEYGCDNLLHPEVIRFSQLLDDFITAYTFNESNEG